MTHISKRRHKKRVFQQTARREKYSSLVMQADLRFFLIKPTSISLYFGMTTGLGIPGFE